MSAGLTVPELLTELDRSDLEIARLIAENEDLKAGLARARTEIKSLRSVLAAIGQINDTPKRG